MTKKYKIGTIKLNINGKHFTDNIFYILSGNTIYTQNLKKRKLNKPK